jgi:UDP-N-acetylglucosamine:LPS N-acetylglucosamine transferase
VPYPVGNGEQKLNVTDVVSGEGGLLVADAEFTADYVANTLVPLISNSRALTAMANSARKVGVADGTARLLALVKGVL